MATEHLDPLYECGERIYFDFETGQWVSEEEFNRRVNEKATIEGQAMVVTHVDMERRTVTLALEGTRTARKRRGRKARPT